MAVDEPPIPDKLLLSPETRIIQGKGEFVAAGATLLVEQLPNSDIVKTLWNDSNRGGYIQDLLFEAKVYQMLGDHPRLVKLRIRDPVQYTTVMKYMPNITLQQYIENHYKDIIWPLQLK